jgi:trans-aconitate 2-methyltransferase
MPRDWNAASYDRLPIPMTRWGATVVEWLDLRGDERVLDAGCGTGQVTALLLDRLPRGSVVALDGSRSMLSRARDRLGDERVEYLEADLEQPLPIEGSVDAILSTATFHWIGDHDALFHHLAAVIKPGGQLAAQCGGEGNIASIQTILADLGVLETGWKNYAGPDDTHRRLQAAGFTDVDVWLQPEPSPVPPDDLESYLETICLSGVVDAMPEPDAIQLVREVARRLPDAVIDYVRLNIRARRSRA